MARMSQVQQIRPDLGPEVCSMFKLSVSGPLNNVLSVVPHLSFPTVQQAFETGKHDVSAAYCPLCKLMS